MERERERGEREREKRERERREREFGWFSSSQIWFSGPISPLFSFSLSLSVHTHCAQDDLWLALAHTHSHREERGIKKERKEWKRTLF